MFFNDNTDLHNLIHKSFILPYLTGSFHPSFIEEYVGGLLMTLEEYVGGLLMTLQKQNGDIHPILYGEIYFYYESTKRRDLESLFSQSSS